MSKFKFFNFSGLRRFLKQDLNSLRIKRFHAGYRQTHTCENCGVTIYSRSAGQWVNCKCGRYSIEENPYYYRFEDYFNPDTTDHDGLKSVQYMELKRRYE